MVVDGGGGGGGGGAGERPGTVSAAVRDLLAPEAEGLCLTLIAGRAGLGNALHPAEVQRPGLALGGYLDYVLEGHVQVIGGTEMAYVNGLTPERRAAAVQALTGRRISCVVITRGQPVPEAFVQQAEAQGVPLLVTSLASHAFITRLSALLEERLAPRQRLHGVLVDVFGLGVLITGESGIGKSECALDLIDRGHRLVADDAVEVHSVSDTLVGTSPDLARDHMELRGLGIINIRDLYGVSSLRHPKRVELVVHLERWEAGRAYDRLGIEAERLTLLGVELPLIRMPVAPGRNLALLVEVAARKQLLKQGGYDAARRFVERADEQLVAGRNASGPAVRSNTTTEEDDGHV